MAKQQLPRGIRLRGNKYFVDVTVGDKRKTATCSTLDEAITRQSELRAALEAGKDIETRRSNARAWTLREALECTLDLPAKEGWRGAPSAKIQAMNVEDAIKYFGEAVTLDTITRDQIKAWCGSCEAKGNSDSTINRKLSSLMKVMKVAKSEGGLAELPKFPAFRKEPKGRIRQVSYEEEEQMLQLFHQLGRDDIAEAVTVLIDTGMRCGELWNVRREDIDFKRKVLLVYGVDGHGTKNGEHRSVIMTDRVVSILKRRSKMDMPFPHNNAWLRHPWDRVRALMGLTEDKDFSPHVLRHTCVSRLVSNGVPLPVVQKWAGHKNIQTTMRYAHLMPNDLLGAAQALERRTA